MNEHYNGNEDLAYIAGFTDADGCFSIVNWHGALISIVNTNAETIMFIKELLLKHKIEMNIYCRKKKSPKYKDVYTLATGKKENVLLFCELLKPYIVLKRERLELLIEMIGMLNDRSIVFLGSCNSLSIL